MGNSESNMYSVEGKILPQVRAKGPEQPNHGPRVHYAFIAGGKTSEVLQPMIDGSHKLGRRLLTFKRKPLSEYFVGIFREPYGDEEREAQLQLGVLNVWLHGQLRSSPMQKAAVEQKRKLWVTDPMCLADAISHTLKHGERVVGISLTTEQKKYFRQDVPSGIDITPGVTKTYWCPHDDELPFDPKMQRHATMVEVFYERPTHQPRERFVYNVATVPVTVTHPTQSTLGLACIFCDWQVTFDQFLNQGWRLVDIFVDFRRPIEKVDSLIMTQFQYKYGSGEDEVQVATWKPIDMDTIWLLEKPASREHDPTPVYEGKIVSFSFQANGNNPQVYWDEMIRSEGSRGWEFACFVERASSCCGPHQPRSKFYSLMFFQRPLPPPDYTELEGFGCVNPCGGEGASGYSEKTGL